MELMRLEQEIAEKQRLQILEERRLEDEKEKKKRAGEKAKVFVFSKRLKFILFLRKFYHAILKQLSSN